MIFNPKNTAYLEEIPATKVKWRFDNVKSEFALQTKLADMTGCLSSTSKQLVMFDGADAQCQKIINRICGGGTCTPKDLDKAPPFKVVFKAHEFVFFGKDYLFMGASGENDQVTCRFTEPDPAENCQPGDLIIGKGFFEKYVPVLRYKAQKDVLKAGAVATSLAWLENSSFYSPESESQGDG